MRGGRGRGEEQVPRDEGAGEFKGELGCREEGRSGADVVEEADEGEGGWGEGGKRGRRELLVKDGCGCGLGLVDLNFSLGRKGVRLGVG